MKFPQLKTMSLFTWHARIQIQRNMAYRLDFFIGLLISIGNAAVGPLFQYLLFTNTKGYPGWNLEQVILFQGMVLLFSGIKGLLFGNVCGYVEDMVWSGTFDRLMTLPYKPIKLLLCSGFNLSNIGAFLTGAFLVVYSCIAMGLRITVLQLLLVLGAILCGLALYAAFLVMYCILLIMVTKNGRIRDIIDALFNFGGYPLEIFPQVIKTVLLTALPFMVFAYFPSQVLLSRADMAILPGAILCFALFGFSLWLWELKLKKYTSAGG